jgi:hypothetical protein
MITLFEQKQLSHKSALAVSRDETNSSDTGIFIIGDLPDLLDPRVNATNDFAGVALLATVDFLTTTIAWYAVTIESLYYGAFGNMSINSTTGNCIVDSDVPVIVLPANDIERWMIMFDPSMPFNSKTLEVNCNATIPILEFRIGGKLFPMNPIDLIIRNAYEKRSYEMAIYERHAYEMVPVRNMPMRDASMRDAPMRDILMRWPMEETRLWDGPWERHIYEMYVYWERHAYEMALVRDTPMGWPMRDARLWETRLWDGFCEKHVYERHAYD